MAIATDEQVQRFADERIRVRAEQVRDLLNAINDDIAGIDSVYAALTQPEPTWADDRADGPPNLLSVNDVLAINACMHDLQTAISGNANLAVLLKACVRPVNR